MSVAPARSAVQMVSRANRGLRSVTKRRMRSLLTTKPSALGDGRGQTELSCL